MGLLCLASGRMHKFVAECLLPGWDIPVRDDGETRQTSQRSNVAVLLPSPYLRSRVLVLSRGQGKVGTCLLVGINSLRYREVEDTGKSPLAGPYQDKRYDTPSV